MGVWTGLADLHIPDVVTLTRVGIAFDLTSFMGRASEALRQHSEQREVRPALSRLPPQRVDHSNHCSGCFCVSLFFTECLTFLTQATYQKLLPLYFPRSLKEESQSLPYLPADIGNAEGEPVVPERQIRISEKPGASEGEC